MMEMVLLPCAFEKEGDARFKEGTRPGFGISQNYTGVPGTRFFQSRDSSFVIHRSLLILLHGLFHFFMKEIIHRYHACKRQYMSASSPDDIVFIVCFQLHSPVQIFLDVEGVFLVIIGCVLIVGMPGDIVLVRQERSDAPKLQDAFIAVHDSQLIPAHQLPSILSSDEFRFGQ